MRLGLICGVLGLLSVASMLRAAEGAGTRTPS